MTKDPACGMEIDEKQATTRTEFRGKTYFFCSVKCKIEFISNPDRYAEPKEDRAGHHHH